MFPAQTKLTSLCLCFPGLPNLPDPDPAPFLEFRDAWLLNRWTLPVALQSSPAAERLVPTFRSPALSSLISAVSLLPISASWPTGSLFSRLHLPPLHLPVPFLSHRTGNLQPDLTAGPKNSVSNRNMLNLDGLFGPQTQLVTVHFANLSLLRTTWGIGKHTLGVSAMGFQKQLDHQGADLINGLIIF